VGDDAGRAGDLKPETSSIQIEKAGAGRGRNEEDNHATEKRSSNLNPPREARVVGPATVVYRNSVINYRNRGWIINRLGGGEVWLSRLVRQKKNQEITETHRDKRGQRQLSPEGNPWWVREKKKKGKEDQRRSKETYPEKPEEIERRTSQTQRTNLGWGVNGGKKEKKGRSTIQKKRKKQNLKFSARAAKERGKHVHKHVIRGSDRKKNPKQSGFLGEI